MEKRTNFNPFDLPPQEYAGLVTTCCQNYRQEIKAKIRKVFPEELNGALAIIAVGSDGKKERHPQSKTELVVLFSKPELVNEIKSLISKLNNNNLQCEEIKPMEDQIMAFYKNNPQEVYPDRILNSFLLWGNPAIYQEARRKVLKEISAKNLLGKKIREAIRKQLSSYKQTIKSGKYRNQQVFDENYQYYFENKDPKQLRFGFKMGPIRVVQRKLDLLTIQAYQNQESTENIVEKAPSNTIARINFFVKIGLIDEDFGQKLQEAYLWFLREYHRIQQAFKDSNRDQVIQLPFNQDDFKKYREIILQFVQ